MAKFELNIYGENDEIIKKYETDHIRYGVLMQALEMQEAAESDPKKQFETANAIVKRVFHGLTDAELELADVNDVLNTFAQVTSQANKIGGSDDSKN